MAIPLLLLASAASSIAQGVGTIAGGFQQASANKAAALGAAIERDMALLRRTQLGEQSRTNLLTALGAIRATRSARGAGLDSPTAQAIDRRTIADSYRDEATAGLAEMMRAGAADQQRRGFRRAASWAVPLSIVQAVPSMISGASGLSNLAPRLGQATNSPMRAG